MTSDARSSSGTAKALATGIATGLPWLLAPQVALADAAGTVVAASVSGLVGTTCGALVSGIVGYAICSRQRREFERTLTRLVGAAEGAPEGAAPVDRPPAEDVSPRAVRDGVASGPEPARTPAPSEVPSASEIIDALPKEPLKIVDSPEDEPGTRERDLRSLPDPLADASPRPSTPPPADGPRVAPGHGALTSTDDLRGPGRFAPSPSNPYLQLDDRPKGVSQAAPSARTDSDYEAIASEYVARKSLRERMSLTATGVASALGERLGRGMMDGLPVIERADGSVADVGTSWWERDERVRRGAAAHPSDPASPGVSPQAPAPGPHYDLTTPSPEAQERSRLIVSRVATIEEEAYPEVHTGEDRGRGDGWERALAALDDRVEDNLMAGRDDRLRRRRARLAVDVIHPQQAPRAEPVAGSRGFGDAVGSIDTIDEPDGLERDTQFLNFRAPGNHPEVQDTGSYINYLIEDEFRRNPSHQVRRQARSYLRVHEGGQNTRAQAM